MLGVGTHLKGGRWHLDARLATGGVSTVFAATHRNGSRAAIKLLDGSFTENDDMRRRFLQEGYAANKVGHPGVVRVLDDDVTEDGRAYLVMELLDGESLDRRRNRLGGKLPLWEALDIADQLLDVLAAAHAHGIIHRDIKPGNLFLTTRGQLKVLDFGFAKVKEAASGESTAVGTLLGTPGFLAPERARGEGGEADARADIWSAGATIFTLITGELVHDAELSVGLLVATGRQPARSLGRVAPELPTALVDVIDRALAFEKDDRWATAREMQEALRVAAKGIERPSPQQAPPPVYVSLVDGEASGEAQTVVAPSALDQAANGAPVGPTIPVPKPTIPVPKMRPVRDDRPLPRLYDDIEPEQGGKGFTQVLPTSGTWRAENKQAPAVHKPAPFPPPALAQLPPPAWLVAPPAEPKRRSSRRTLWLLIGVALALLGTAFAVITLLESGR